MSRYGLMLLSMLVLSGALSCAAADGPGREVEDLFIEAGRAYDENRLADAIAGYERVREKGHLAPELFFNLGNAWFRQGRPGRAILNYRRAWYFAPRDPDLRANLRFALDTAGAPEPEQGLPQRWLFRASRAEWRAAGLAAWWLCSALLCVCLLLRSRPAWLLRAAGLALIVALIALVGVRQWRRLAESPEVVILEKNVEVLFAPIDGATVHFAAPEGSILRVVDRSGAWRKVERGRQQGWIQASTCAPVAFWLASSGDYMKD